MIAVPIAIQSFVETMENVEAACSVGDHYPLMECMLVDGFGTLLGAVMGCPLPTTVYIGHTRHKAIGASGGYSLLNAATFFVMLVRAHSCFPCGVITRSRSDVAPYSFLFLSCADGGAAAVDHGDPRPRLDRRDPDCGRPHDRPARVRVLGAAPLSGDLRCAHVRHL
jgi:hypothetical protein